MVEASTEIEEEKMGLIHGDQEDDFDSEDLDDEQLNSLQGHSIAA